MKNYLKNEIKHLPMIIIVSIIFCGINTLANNHLFSSKDVDYDNSNTHIESTNVGDAIDELFDAANNFTTYDTRLQGVETKVGTGTLNTTSQTLIGGVNEVTTSLDEKTTYKSGDTYFTNQWQVFPGLITSNDKIFEFTVYLPKMVPTELTPIISDLSGRIVLVTGPLEGTTNYLTRNNTTVTIIRINGFVYDIKIKFDTAIGSAYTPAVYYGALLIEFSNVS